MPNLENIFWKKIFCLCLWMCVLSTTRPHSSPSRSKSLSPVFSSSCSLLKIWWVLSMVGIDFTTHLHTEPLNCVFNEIVQSVTIFWADSKLHPCVLYNALTFCNPRQVAFLIVQTLLLLHGYTKDVDRHPGKDLGQNKGCRQMVLSLRPKLSGGKHFLGTNKIT